MKTPHSGQVEKEASKWRPTPAEIRRCYDNADKMWLIEAWGWRYMLHERESNDWFGWTPAEILFLGAAGGNAKFVEQALEKGASPVDPLAHCWPGVNPSQRIEPETMATAFAWRLAPHTHAEAVPLYTPLEVGIAGGACGVIKLLLEQDGNNAETAMQWLAVLTLCLPRIEAGLVLLSVSEQRNQGSAVNWLKRVFQHLEEPPRDGALRQRRAGACRKLSQLCPFYGVVAPAWALAETL